jgi:hypothetical protein
MIGKFKNHDTFKKIKDIKRKKRPTNTGKYVNTQHGETRKMYKLTSLQNLAKET